MSKLLAGKLRTENTRGNVDSESNLGLAAIKAKTVKRGGGPEVPK